jgi:hypothetical protein
VNVTQGMAVPLQIEDNIAANAKSAYFEWHSLIIFPFQCTPPGRILLNVVTCVTYSIHAKLLHSTMWTLMKGSTFTWYLGEANRI